MGWENASEVGRVVAISHVLLVTILAALRMHAWERLCTLFIGFGGAAYLSFPLLYEAHAPRLVLLPVVLLQSAASFWFWLFALIQGRESFRPNWRHWLLLAAKLALTLIWASDRRERLVPIAPDQEFVWRALVPAGLTVAFALAAVFAAGRSFDDELVEGRRRMRRLVILWGAAVIVAVIGIVLVFRGPVLGEIGAWLKIAIALGVSLNIYLRLVQTAERDAPESRQGRTVQGTPELKRLAERIEELFAVERYYETEGLTVRALASRLNEHDYKVRRAINGVLGYRNFNAFLNQHRVAAARLRLVDEPELPVLRLAMDLGYRSLAVFNKAFKEATGRTPTDYRRTEMAD